jgi:hypothetical protein
MKPLCMQRSFRASREAKRAIQKPRSREYQITSLASFTGMYQSVDFSCLHLYIYIYIFYPVFLCMQSLKDLFRLQEQCLQEIQPLGDRRERAEAKGTRGRRRLFPAAAKQLEFSPRPEPVIRTSTKKVFTQPPAFGDTEANTGTKVVLPHWGELFKKISREEFPEYIPHSDPDMRKLDDEVFPNIRRSYLHMVARRTPVFPCIELLKWLIDHMDTQKCLINDDNGECVGVFLPVEVQKYYKLRDPEERLNTDFVVKFYECHDTSRVMASWWREDKKYTNRTFRLVPNDQLKGTIHLPNGSHLPVVWGERLLQIFRGMDASSLHSGHFWEWVSTGEPSFPNS